MADMAAIKTMDPHPKLCHIPEPIYVGKKPGGALHKRDSLQSHILQNHIDNAVHGRKEIDHDPHHDHDGDEMRKVADRLNQLL